MRPGLLILLFLFTGLLISDAQAFTVPPFSSPVVDQANLLDDTQRQRLAGILQQLHHSGGSQIAILTVPTLDGLPIEQASIQVVDQWKLGSGAADNGVLLIIAAKERSLRIEVGQGLEGDLPDAYAKRIIADTMIPYLRDGRVYDGLLAGVGAIVARTDPKFDPSQLGIKSSYAGERRSMGQWPSFGLLMFILFIFMLLSKLSVPTSGFGRGRRGGYYGGSGWGSGSSGSWGGGGGFSGGGGGGFSGGGASGQW